MDGMERHQARSRHEASFDNRGALSPGTVPRARHARAARGRSWAW
jgi:hypothetical protein